MSVLPNQLLVRTVDSARVAALRLQSSVLTPGAAAAPLPALPGGIVSLDAGVEALGTMVRAKLVLLAHATHGASSGVDAARLLRGGDLAQTVDRPREVDFALDLGGVGLFFAPRHPRQFDVDCAVQAHEVERLDDAALAGGNTD
ncbi:MAG TPA: hypothetical protein VLG36_05090 [Candidatus Chromulinivoraceae bacterium]|nr:hypothetical protein [Candidatus Chromulinivoraceae bacterium]